MSPQLAQVERVAAAAGPELAGQLAEVGVERVPDGVGHVVLHGGPVEPLERQPGHGVVAPQVGEAAGEGLAELVPGVAERAEHQHPGGQPDPGEVGEQREGLRARPVQVVEDDEGAPPRRRRAQDPPERPVEPGAGDGGVHVRLRRGPRPVDPGAVHAQGRQLVDRLLRVGRREHLVRHLDPRLVGQREVGVAAAEDDGGARVVHGPAELGGQSGLPGARLAADEHDLPAGDAPGPRGVEHGQGRGPSDEGVSR